MKRMYFPLIVLSFLCTAFAVAADYVPFQFYRNALSKTAADVKLAPGTIWPIRREGVLYVGPGADGTISLKVKNQRITTYGEILRYALTDRLGQVILKGTIDINKTVVLKTQKLPFGVYKLEMSAGGNSLQVSEPTGLCFMETNVLAPLQMIWGCPKLYFTTKPGKDGKLHLKARGDSTEHFVVNVWDANGKQVFSRSTYRKPNRGQSTLSIDIPVPKEQAGSVWSLQLTEDPSPDVRFEDMALWVESGAEPGFALTPSSLGCTGIHRMLSGQPDGSFFIGFVLSDRVIQRPGLGIDFSFKALDGSEVPSSHLTGLTDKELGHVGLRIPKDKLAFGDLHIELKDEKEGTLLVWDDTVFVSHNKFYTEVVHEEEGTPAVPNQAENERGYQLFQRDEPGFVRRKSRPADTEIISKLAGEVSGGMVSTEFFAVQPLRDFNEMTIDITDLRGPYGKIIPNEFIHLFSVKRWPQAEEYVTMHFLDMPEMLEKKQTVSLKAKTPQLFAVQAKVPNDTAPGVYRGMVTLNGKAVLPYELTIDDFEVPEVPSMTFGLYPDTKRWKELNYTDAEIEREMKVFREYGITAMLVYPMVTADIKWDGKKLHVNLDEFRKQMKIYKTCGFYGVLVVDLQQAVRQSLPEIVGVKDFNDSNDCLVAYGDLLDAIKAAADADQWPRYCIHTVDEPFNEERAKFAVKTLKFVKERGFKTFNTCYKDMVRQFLAPYLDYRCYNNIAYMSLQTPELARELREETLKDGDEFWWYGSGSYNNGKFLEDGNIYSNRHMLGLFAWRSKATGVWSWTFLRPHKDQFDDFDSSKDDCMCYQTPGENTLISTLQWEAVREGTYDYRYLCLWESLVKKAKADPAKATRALQSEGTVTAAIDAIAWTARGFAVNNGQLRALRKLLIREIKALK